MKLIKRQLYYLLMLLFINSTLVKGQIDVLAAALENDYISIEETLQKGHNAFEIESSGISLVDYAISSGDYNLLTTIVNNAHSISQKDIFSIFSKAIDYKQSEMIEYLLSQNLHTTINNTEMYNLVFLAIGYDNADIYQLLTENTPRIEGKYQEFLFAATRSNRFNVFSCIFKNKNIHASEKNTNESLIHEAVEANSFSIAEFLIHKGADVNALTTNGQTPLHLTSSFDIAQLLIEKGAMINIEDNHGHTPLYYAQKAGDTDMVRLLKSALKK